MQKVNLYVAYLDLLNLNNEKQDGEWTITLYVYNIYVQR
jgi:hypothetical protein